MPCSLKFCFVPLLLNVYVILLGRIQDHMGCGVPSHVHYTQLHVLSVSDASGTEWDFSVSN